jgi:hypothetical protein
MSVTDLNTFLFTNWLTIALFRASALSALSDSAVETSTAPALALSTAGAWADKV